MSSTVIKLDIEGEEYNALKGAQKIINNFRPVFFIEINKREINDGSSLAFNFLKNNNYSFFNIESKTKPKKDFLSRLFYSNELIVKEITELKQEYYLYVCLICIPN